MIMSREASGSSSTNRASRMLRFGVLAFGVGILVGQCVNQNPGMMDYLSSIDMSSSTMKIRDSLSSSNRLEAVTKKYGPVKTIALIGERNSGTTWMTSELKKCFASDEIEVKVGLTRDKHWFQADDSTVPRKSTVVVAQFRNVYDWSASMRGRPHHSPEHLRLDLEEFLTKPWGMKRPSRDLPYKDENGPICQLGYSYKEIVPCLREKQKPLRDPNEKRRTDFSGWDPQYELRRDGSGQPYDSIIQLRYAKIKNAMAIKNWDWIADVEMIRYESLLEEGTGPLMERLEKILGVKMNCTPSPPAPERLANYANLEPKVIKLINSLTNWDGEALLGYEKRPLDFKV